jgi:hypothetical protein
MRIRLPRPPLLACFGVRRHTGIDTLNVITEVSWGDDASS